MNPMQMIKTLIQAKKNPQEMISSLMNGNDNPMIKNLVGMAEKGDKEGVENFARNLFKEKGMDFDAEFNKFMGNFKQ